MDDAAVRVIVVVVVVAVALGAGWLAGRRARPTHPPVRLDGLGLPPGVVVFTSSACDNCKRVMAMMPGVGAPVREVSHELEAGVQQAAGVVSVPLVVVTDRDGAVVSQLAGVPSGRQLRSAVAAAGWTDRT